MIRSEKLRYSYTVWENETENKRTALADVDLDIGKGEFVVILGRNGSGKSTFAKHLNAILVPDSGSVLIDGKNTSERSLVKAIRDLVGMTFQNPDNQIIGTSVEEDVAFSPEQRNVAPEEIRSRVENSLLSVGLLDKRKTSPFRLSGGQKQRLAIAGTLASDTECIVLDEPTAMLDPSARREMIAILHRLHSRGKTIILITHHTDEALGADRIVIMNAGQVTAQGTPSEIFAQPDLLRASGLDMPKVTDTAHRLAAAGFPISTPVLSTDDFAEQVSKALAGAERGAGETEEAAYSDKAEAADPILSVRDVCFSYDRGTVNESQVLKGLSFDIRKGEFLGLAGASGAGKTTLAKHLNGLLKADSGEVLYKGQNIYDKSFRLSSMRKRVGLIFQNPEQQLFSRTLIKDVCFGPLNMGMTEEEALSAAKNSLELVGIDPSFYETSPYEMSGGQMRRAAIAGVLAMDPEVLILDEPAAGLDPGSRDSMLELLENIRRERGTSIVLISHNMNDIAERTDRMLVLSDGAIAAEGTPGEVFGNEAAASCIGVPDITAAMNRIEEAGISFPHKAVTVEEAAEMILGMYRGGGES